ncbi:MAG: MurR/RpiR family transcriptional regulator [Clostridia bacterium]|nr:MurR/RpiR family transcriptional regulator [Clostridia bacterium]
MDKTSIKINVLYPSMSKAEKRIADWLYENPNEILALSIVELAEKCQCSEATIVRFAKRLGLSGYQGLKISLAQESESAVTNTKITDQDSPYEIYGKVCNDIYCALERTKNSLDKKQLSDAAERLAASERIIIFGLGNSASVATDMSHKLLRAGCNSVAYSDNHMQVIAASHLTEKDTVVGISHSGSSRDIVEALKIAKDHGAVTVCITNKGKSPVTKVSDIILETSAEETKYSILGLSSRIAQLSIVDSLYYYVVHRNTETAMESIKETERSLLSKKY